MRAPQLTHLPPPLTVPSTSVSASPVIGGAEHGPEFDSDGRVDFSDNFVLEPNGTGSR